MFRLNFAHHYLHPVAMDTVNIRPNLTAQIHPNMSLN